MCQRASFPRLLLVNDEVLVTAFHYDSLLIIMIENKTGFVQIQSKWCVTCTGNCPKQMPLPLPGIAHLRLT